MTVVEIQTKIDQFEKLMTKADVIEKADLQMIVDDLETERIKLLTAGLRNIDTNDLQELDNIADSFKQGTLEIKNQTELIGQAISIGKNLVSKFT